MARSSRILIAAVFAVGCSVCSECEARAESIRVRTSNDETTALVRTMLEKISARESELVARSDVATWGPGFKRFAEGECDILVNGAFPDQAEMKHLSWTLPVGARLQEYIAGQQRVLVVVNKANPATSVSLKQLTKMLAPSDKPAVWSDIGGTGGRARIFMEPAKSTSVRIVREKCLRKAEGGAVTIQDIRKEVEYCADSKAVIDGVQRNRNGIGFLSDSNLALTTVKVLAVVDLTGRSVHPLPGPVFQKDYPLSSWLLLYLHPKAPHGAKELCEFLCGPTVASIATDSGFTTRTAIEQAKTVARMEAAKSPRAPVVCVAGLAYCLGLASDLANLYVSVGAPMRVNFAAAPSGHDAIGLFLARRDMVILESQPNELAMRTYGPAWKDAMPVPFLIAGRAAAIIVNPVNKLPSLTLGQIETIFAGEVTDWQVIGGTGLRPAGDAPRHAGLRINVLGLPGREAVTQLFEKECLPRRQWRGVKVKKDTAEAVKAVSMDPQAIAFVDLAAIPAAGQNVRILPIKFGMGKKARNVAPKAETIRKAMYPLSQRYFLYVHPKAGDTAKDFASFLATCGRSEANPYADTVKAVMGTYHKHGLIPLADAAIERAAKDTMAETAAKARAEEAVRGKRR